MQNSNWVKYILLGLLLFNGICFSFPLDNAKQDSLLKILVITGIHDYDTLAFNELFNSFTEDDCAVKAMGENPGVLFENVEEFPYEVIVLYNFGQSLSEKHRTNFKNILGKGVGLVVMHHALAGFPNWVEYEETIGATYVLKEQDRDGKHYKRPEYQHDVDMEIKVMDKAHPITKGISDFTIHDETYKYWVYHDGSHLLLSTDNELSNYQIAWTRFYNNTRVFVIQLGHDKYAYENNNYIQILERGIEWVSKNEK